MIKLMLLNIRTILSGLTLQHVQELSSLILTVDTLTDDHFSNLTCLKLNLPFPPRQGGVRFTNTTKPLEL